MAIDAIRAFATKDDDPTPKSTPSRSLHLAIVVPDIRLYQLIKNKFRVIQPPYDDIAVQLHVVIDDQKDPHRDLDWQIRIALVQSGLVEPGDMNITYPDQVTLGWPEDQQ